MTTRNPHAVPRDPLKLAIGEGASGTGVRPWWLQRLTALALVPLSLWFLFFLGSALGGTYLEVRAAIGAPLPTLLLITFVVCLFWHGVLGLDVIIDDYVHSSALNFALRIATRFSASLIVLASVLAVLAIWLRIQD